MVLKIATTSLHWGHPSVPQSPSSAQTLASAISSPCSKRRSFVAGDGALFCRYGDWSSKLYRSRSCDNPRSRVLILRRAVTASLASFSDEEFSKQIQELALKFQLSYNDQSIAEHRIVEARGENGDEPIENLKSYDAALEQPSFPERKDIISVNIERKANSVEIPFSLRIIKRKKQLQEGFREAGESAYCSVKKAFSSMVFIIQELHNYSLQMREVLFYEDLQGILARVQEEMNASFVWLFQQVFSHTPTLMVYVMILLANYSVHSLASYAAIAATPTFHSHATEEVSVSEDQSLTKQKFDSSIIKTLNLSSSNGKTTSVGGNNGGGGKYKPIASGADGDGRFESNFNQTIIPDGVSSVEYSSITNGEESVSMQEEEVTVWNLFVEEASRIQDFSLNQVLDQERLISPVDGKIEADDEAEYFKTEMQYQTGLAQEPSNSLLLANYAQFLYLVAQDFDRAEEYFKKATTVEPKDAEALNKYANFLWKVKNDLWAAEETYLEAIAAEPGNSYYAANYAHFLWNTGGEDTCFPLSSPDTSSDL